MLTRTTSPFTISRDMPFGEGPFHLLARASPSMDIEEAGFLSLSGCFGESRVRLAGAGSIVAFEKGCINTSLK